MSGERSFPPGVGWLQAAAVTAVVLLAAGVAAAPRFQTKVVGTSVNGAGDVPGIVTGTKPNGTANPSTTVGKNPGTGPAVGSKGGPGNGVALPRDPSIDCAHGKNGGSTAPGVSATKIQVASTVVTSGPGQDFLGEAAAGMKAALEAANAAGGVCGRQFELHTLNSGWDRTAGQNDIEGWIHAGKTFALVGQPDSEGLDAATQSGVIDGAKIPVVGTDGMLKSQYASDWIWPVAASTVANMHIVADYAVDSLHANTFGIVYDTDYKFGKEGATAFAEQLGRRGKSIKGYSRSSKGCSSADGAYCGISSHSQSYSTEVQNFNAACKPCDVVVLLLEPAAAISWMNQENSNTSPWYGTLIGGEPLFDDRFGQQCSGCGKAKLMVWTGYRAAIQPFESEKAVYTYCQRLHAQSASADCHNEFTEGAYLGASLFVEAVKRVGYLGLPLTRDNLKLVLDANPFALGLTYKPLDFGAPHAANIANVCMTAFADNYSGSFNGWNYLSDVAWRCDKNPTLDLR
jgi:ABC-type branched-subunit amino acid transport system substrate-binding protein